jgi:hypothetical protein
VSRRFHPRKSTRGILRAASLEWKFFSRDFSASRCLAQRCRGGIFAANFARDFYRIVRVAGFGGAILSQ